MAKMKRSKRTKKNIVGTMGLTGAWLSSAGYVLSGIFLAAVLLLDYTAAVSAESPEEFYLGTMQCLDRMDQAIFVLMLLFGVLHFIQIRYRKGMEFLYALPSGRNSLFTSGYLAGAGMLFAAYAGIFILSALQLTGSIGQLVGLSVWYLIPVCFGRFLAMLFLFSLLFFLHSLFSGTAKASVLLVLFAWGANYLADLLDRILYVYFGWRKQGVGCGIRDSLLVLKNLKGSFDRSVEGLAGLGFRPYRAIALEYPVSFPLIAIAVLLLCAVLFLVGRRLAVKSDFSRRIRIFSWKTGRLALLLLILLPVILFVLGRDISKNINKDIRYYNLNREWKEEDYRNSFQMKYGTLVEENESWFETYKESLNDPTWKYAYVDETAADMKSYFTVPYYVTYSAMDGMSADIGRFFIIVGIPAAAVTAGYFWLRYLRKEENR